MMTRVIVHASYVYYDETPRNAPFMKKSHPLSPLLTDKKILDRMIFKFNRMWVITDYQCRHVLHFKWVVVVGVWQEPNTASDRNMACQGIMKHF